MRVFFIFFLRLFICFIAAKFILRTLGQGGLDYLVGLTVLLTANIYLFDYLEYHHRLAFRQESPLSLEANGSKKVPPQVSPPEVQD